MRLLLALVIVTGNGVLTSGQIERGDTEIRGCLADSRNEADLGLAPPLVLSASPVSDQSFDAPIGLDEGQLYGLVGDPGVLEDLARLAGQEVEIRGELNPPEATDAIQDPTIIEAPWIGLPGTGFPQSRERQRRGRQPVPLDVVEVHEFRLVGPSCRR